MKKFLSFLLCALLIATMLPVSTLSAFSEKNSTEESTTVNGNIQTIPEIITISCAEHQYGSLIPEVPAQYDKEGKKAHYECSICHKLFDENKVEVREEQLVIPAIGSQIEDEGTFLGGDGTKENPYLISNKYQLNNVRNYLDSHFKLVTDVVFTKEDFTEGGDFYNYGQGWAPIGTDGETAFTGVFDGDGHIIQGLYINITPGSVAYAGLFGYNRGTIRSVGVVGGNVTATSTASDTNYAYAGGITGWNSGAISECYFTGFITATSSSPNSPAEVFAGGIAGYHTGTIDQSYNTGSISAHSSYHAYAGGIVGNSSASAVIEACYNIGAISASANNSLNIGGIAGKSNGLVNSCYYLDTVSKGVGGGTDQAVKCTEKQMKQKSTYTDFDFDKIWEFIDEDFYPFPSLKKLPHSDFIEENTEDFAGGTGSVLSPYLISTKDHLNNVRNHMGAHFKMIEDVVFTEEDFLANGEFYNQGSGWQPIGESSDSPFYGVFDGNGHTIKGLSIKITYDLNAYAGLFGFNKGTIYSLGVINSDITVSSTGNDSYVGGIIGNNDNGTVSECYTDGSIKITASSDTVYAGGLIGYNSGAINECYNMGSVTINSSIYSGAITGYNTGSINESSNRGTVSASTSTYVGGIVGQNGGNGIIGESYNIGKITAGSSSRTGGIAGVNTDGTISKCFNEGTISASTSACIGGITGENSGKGLISESYNIGKITASSSARAGGVAGVNTNGNISRCFNKGAISSSTSAYAGGIVGYNTGGEISENFNNGDISASSSTYVGGITGYNNKGLILTCYNTGNITITNGASNYTFRIGGIVGYNNSGTIDKCYNIGSIALKISTNTVMSYTDIGGIAGYNNSGTINQCYNMGSVFDTNIYYDSNSGGIVGYNSGTVSGCYNNGMIKTTANGASDVNIGGIAGYNNKTINDSRNSGMISAVLPSTANATINIGGVVGYNNSAITDCCNTGTISDASLSTFTYAFAGGIAGSNYKSVSGCYNTGKVTTYSSASSGRNHAGGIVGYNINSSIRQCYNTGAVSSSYNSYAGGITGYNVVERGYYSAVIQSCNNIGTVTAVPISRNLAGGIAGYNSGYGKITACYYRGSDSGVAEGSDTTIKNNSLVIHPIISPQMYAGFDFTNIWIQDTYLDYHYPQLQNNRQERIQSIELVTSPNNGQTVQNCLPDLTGASLRLNYEDGKQAVITPTTKMLHNFDSSELGEQTVYFIYGGCISHEGITIEVVSKSISEISVTSLPNKTTYVLGQPLNLSGGKITVYYDDNTNVKVDLDQAQISYPLNQSGTVTVVVEYAGFTTEFNITVNEKQVQSISITKPSKTSYVEGEEFDVTGGELHVTYVSNDNYTETIPLEHSMIVDYVPNQLGEQILTISYQGAVTTLTINVRPSAPVTPKPASITDTKITLAAVSGYEYRMDDGEWQQSNVFAGLAPNSTHNFYQRVAATDDYSASDSSEALSLTTHKSQSDTPDAPVFISKTDTTVTLQSVDNCEYRMEGENWQDSPVFSGLDPNTTYKFYQRVKETHTHTASNPSAELSVTTYELPAPTSPNAPTLSAKTDTTVTLDMVDGCEYRMDNGKWQQSNVFTGLIPNSTHNFYQRIAQTEQHCSSESSPALEITTDKSQASLPKAPLLLKSESTSITLVAVSGYEYSMDGIHWQDSPIFLALTPETEYCFYQRIKETDTNYASQISMSLTVKTEPEYIVGDLNGDEKVNLDDVAYLLNHVYFPARYPVYQNCDFSGDEIVSLDDVAYLLNHIYFPDRYPLK